MGSLFYRLGELSVSSPSSSSSGAGQVDGGPGRPPRWLAPLAIAVIIFSLVVVVSPVTPLTPAGYVVLVLTAVTVYDTAGIMQAYEKRMLTVFRDYRDILGPGLNVAPPFISEAHHFGMRV